MSLSSNDKKVITDYAEVEKQLNKFRGTRAHCEMEILGKTYEGTITSVSDITLSIHYKGLIPVAATFVEVSITSGHTIYSFRTSILDIHESEVTMSAPTELRVLVKRKYKRVNIEDDREAKLEFTVVSGSGMGADSSKVVPKYAQIFQELSKKVPNIKTIVQLIMQQLREYADKFDIRLYKKGDNFSIPEEIIKTLGETVYIRNTRDRTSYLSTTIPKVISLGAYLKHLKEQNKNDDYIKGVMFKTISEDQKKGVRSYIFSPITLFGEVIGHIYVANLSKEFNDQNVYITISMAEIISEAFVKTKIFQLESAGAIKGEIINLSAGGALIEINDQYVMKFLHPHTKLKVSLEIKDVSEKLHTFNCSAKVLRVITNDEKNRVAIKFLELRWNEHDMIDKFIRKKIEFRQALNN